MPVSRLLRSALLLIVAVLAFAPVARAQEPEPAPNPDEAVLRELYANFDRFLLNRDMDGVVALMARDVTFQSNSGKRRNLEQWRKAFDRQLNSLVQTRTRVESVALRGNSADVKTWCEQRYENLKIEGAEQKKFIIRSGALDHWVKTPEGWRLKSSRQQDLDVEPLD